MTESSTRESSTRESSTTGPASAGPAAAGPDEFVRACSVSELPAEGAIGVEIDGAPVAIVRAEGEIYALRDVCSHAEVPLSEGEVYDHTVECWLHGSCFDLRTGEPTGPPATKPVPTYPVRIQDDEVFVSLGAQQAGATT